MAKYEPRRPHQTPAMPPGCNEKGGRDMSLCMNQLPEAGGCISSLYMKLHLKTKLVKCAACPRWKTLARHAVSKCEIGRWIATEWENSAPS
jgi:hypothetical protein